VRQFRVGVKYVGLGGEVLRIFSKRCVTSPRLAMAYRTLSRRGNPQFKTVLGVIGALGMRVQIAPAETRPS